MSRLYMSTCVAVALLLLDPKIVGCYASLSLTPSTLPSLNGSYCANVGTVNFTCTGRAQGALHWFTDGISVAEYVFRSSDEYPFTMPLPLLNITVIVVNATEVSSGPIVFDVISVLIVGDISRLDDITLQCGENSPSESNSVPIHVENISAPDAPVPANCSLLASHGGANISLQWPWSPSFTSQYSVERYRVSVNPDPSSCSSDQVSPSEDYSCSGLVLGTRYTFTVSAINCGDQEGEKNVINAFFGGHTELGDLKVVGEQDKIVRWNQSSYAYEVCLPVGDIEYIVELVDNTGEVVEQRVVTSDSCSNGTCSILIPPSGTCLVRVQATSPFGNSTSTAVNIAGVRLTTTNHGLLVAGVILLSVAIVITIILIIMTALKRGSKISFLLLLLGCVLVVLSLVLWIAVAFHVVLQQNLCDPSWQSTRDALIIAAHVISDLAFLVEVVAAGFVCLAITCCGDYCMKSTSTNKAQKFVFKWLSPIQPRTGPTNSRREPVEIAMEEHKKRGQSGYQRGAGGRVTDLEAEDIIVDEFKQPGERTSAGTLRAGEEVFQKYDRKLKEKEEAAQYDTTTHVKTPASATPTQPATYSQLSRLKEKVTGGGGVGEYQQLDHNKGSKGGIEVDKRKHLPPSEEYGTLETEMPPGPPPGGVRKSGKEVRDNSNGQDKEKSPSAPKKPARSPAAQHNTSSSKGTGYAVGAPGTYGNHAPDTVDEDGYHKARSKQIKKDYDALGKKFPPGKLNMVLDEEHRGEDTHLVMIAAVFEEDWDKTVAPALGLTADEIKATKREYKNKAEQKRRALKTWKDREGKRATYGNLLRLLVTCENKLYASTLPELWSSSI